MWNGNKIFTEQQREALLQDMKTMRVMETKHGNSEDMDALRTMLQQVHKMRTSNTVL